MSDVVEFNQWMNRVTKLMIAKYGFSPLDLADAPYYDWFDDGFTPRQAMVLAAAENF